MTPVNQEQRFNGACFIAFEHAATVSGLRHGRLVKVCSCTAFQLPPRGTPGTRSPVTTHSVKPS